MPAFPADVVTDYSRAQACAITIALTINITLCDPIVYWLSGADATRLPRPAPRSSATPSVRPVPLRLSPLGLPSEIAHAGSRAAALGLTATTQGCNARGSLYTHCTVMFTTGVMYERLPARISACVLSLAAHGAATGLVAYKAWESRTRLKGYLVAGRRAAQVEKLLALLVESGAVYCALGVVIVALQFKFSQHGLSVPLWSTNINSFLDIFGVWVNGALVPAIAIYPALIAVLVALDRSHIEKAFMENDKGALDAFQLGHIATDSEANTRPGGPNENRNSLGARPELLIELGLSDLRRIDSEYPGDTFCENMGEGERRKPEGIV